MIYIYHHFPTSWLSKSQYRCLFIFTKWSLTNILLKTKDVSILKLQDFYTTLDAIYHLSPPNSFLIWLLQHHWLLIFLLYLLLTKKHAQLESCQLSFICGKMRIAAQEAIPQIALRDCSKASVGVGQHIRFWWRRNSIPISTHFTKGFLLVMRSWCHHKGIYCFSRYEEIQGLR